MPKKEENKKEEKMWVAGLRVIDETRPPELVIQNTQTEEQYSIAEAVAELLNIQEDLKGLLG